VQKYNSFFNLQAFFKLFLIYFFSPQNLEKSLVLRTAKVKPLSESCKSFLDLFSIIFPVLCKNFALNAGAKVHKISALASFK